MAKDKVGEMIGQEIRRSVRHYLAAVGNLDVCQSTVNTYWENIQYWHKKMEEHRKELRSELGRDTRARMPFNEELK